MYLQPAEYCFVQIWPQTDKISQLVGVSAPQFTQANEAQ